MQSWFPAQFSVQSPLSVLGLLDQRWDRSLTSALRSEVCVFARGGFRHAVGVDVHRVQLPLLLLNTETTVQSVSSEHAAMLDPFVQYCLSALGFSFTRVRALT